jgi:3-hydroxyisobutyrate dehydrogenase
MTSQTNDIRGLEVGWIGTGVMGAPMCGHLLDAGCNLTIYTRTQERAEGLLSRGAAWAASPADVATTADVVMTMVGFPEDVERVYFGSDGLLAAIRTGTTLIDFTTTRPSLSVRIAEAARTAGAFAIDAPVSGGDVGAKQGTLSIMVGGDTTAVGTVLPLMRCFGERIVHQGPPGAGQHAKMCNQITIAGTMIGVCECLIYGHRAGLDLDTMLESIRSGAAGCWTLDQLAPRVLQRNFDPGFFVDHFIKDMEIALLEARRMGVVLPGLALVHQLYLAVRAQGGGQLGTHALIKALEQLSGEPV